MLCHSHYRISIRWSILPSFLRPGVLSTSPDNSCTTTKKLFTHIFGTDSGPSRYAIFLALAMVLFLAYMFLFSDSTWNHSKTKRFISQDFYEHGINSHYHYGIVIDCGSSGSRVFIYYWPPHNGNPDDLLQIKQMKDSRGNPARMKIKPGLILFLFRWKSLLFKNHKFLSLNLNLVKNPPLMVNKSQLKIFTNPGLAYSSFEQLGLGHYCLLTSLSQISCW